MPWVKNGCKICSVTLSSPNRQPVMLHPQHLRPIKISSGLVLTSSMPKSSMLVMRARKPTNDVPKARFATQFDVEFGICVSDKQQQVARTYFVTVSSLSEGWQMQRAMRRAESQVLHAIDISHTHMMHNAIHLYRQAIFITIYRMRNVLARMLFCRCCVVTVEHERYVYPYVFISNFILQAGCTREHNQSAQMMSCMLLRY